MGLPKCLPAVTFLLISAAVAAQSANAGNHANRVNSMHTAVIRGPLSDSAGVFADPGYGLFTCQVGRAVGQCFDPYQMRRAYGVDTLIAKGFDGRGKTIVIIDAFDHPNLSRQFDVFNTFYGLPPVNAGPGTPTFTEVAPDGLGGFNESWAFEISLDVEWAHAIAPGANIVLELAKDNSDLALISALNDAIDHDRGDVVSMSFGESDTCLGPELTAAWHQAFVNATAKGITLFASTGDEGAAQYTCDGDGWMKAASSPASDPLVAGVAGTALQAADYCLAILGCDPAKNPAAGTYLSETVWNEGKYGDFAQYFPATEASGGGFSTVWSEPPYQQGTIHGGKQRGVGDVSYNAAEGHGVLTYIDLPTLPAGFYAMAGTSAGTPQWAAITAIADQAAGHDYGFVNAALYKIGQNVRPYSAAFHDVTIGTNSAIEFDQNNNSVDITGYNAGKGWDAATGLGSPNATNLLPQLAAFWSSGQTTAAAAASKAKGQPSYPGAVKPH